MNVNNFNFFERHAEKITLAVAAAAAAYLIYMAWPLMLPVETSAGSGQFIPADQVETEVTKAVEALDNAREQTRKRADIAINVKNYIDEYRKIMEGQPLPEALVKADVPPFGPRNLAVDASVSPSELHDVPVATPTAPMPTLLAAITWRGVVNPVAPTPAGPGQPAPAPPAGTSSGVDKDLVLIKGVVDLNPMIKQMASLPPAFQRTVIYRIELQRRQRVAGGWSAFVDAPQSKAVTPVDIDWSKIGDAELKATVDAVDQQLKQIAQPEYYPTITGGSVVQQLLGGLPAAAPAPNDPTAPAAPAPPGGASPAAAATSNTVPIWALDDTVDPGAEYQYKIRVVMYNPTYRWPHALVDPKMKNQPTIASEWAMVPNAVDIKANMYFFITGGGFGGGTRISGWVYKWSAGHWYKGAVNASPGLPIAASVKLGDGKTVDVPTGLTLVDVSSTGSGPEVVAVLMDSNGELSTRLSSTDTGSDQNWKDIDRDSSTTTKPAPLTPKRPTFPGTPPMTPAGSPPGSPPGTPPAALPPGVVPGDDPRMSGH